jgi:hypothetical protein
LDKFPADLSYCLHLLIGFNVVKVYHGRQLTAMGGVGPLMVVESDPSPDLPGRVTLFPKRTGRRIHISRIARDVR